MGFKIFVVISGYDILREIFIKYGDVMLERFDIFIIREVGKFKGIIVEVIRRFIMLCLFILLGYEWLYVLIVKLI